jgi:hypothetical protein
MIKVRRNDRKALYTPWFLYGSAVLLGPSTELLAEGLSPLWMLIKPRPTTVGVPFVGTPFEPLASWLAFLLLYVPDIFVLLLIGFLAGRYLRRHWLSWLSVCVLSYATFVVLRGGGVWWYAAHAAIYGLTGDFVLYGTLSLAILGSPYAAGTASRWLSGTEPPSGICKKCRYPLYGLQSTVCPECGTPFTIEENKESPDATSLPNEPQKLARGERVFLLRIAFLGVAVGLFYALDWTHMRTSQRDLIQHGLQVAGYAPVPFDYNGSPALTVGDRAHFFTAECTYADLFLIVLPFLWVVGARRGSNALRLLAAGLIILGGNLVRSFASVYINVLGVSWFWAHDLPDYLLWWPTFLYVLLQAMRHDLGSGSPSRVSNVRHANCENSPSRIGSRLLNSRFLLPANT